MMLSEFPPGGVEHIQKLKGGQAGLMPKPPSTGMPENGMTCFQKGLDSMRVCLEHGVICSQEQLAIGMPILSAKRSSVPIKLPCLLPQNLATPFFCLLGGEILIGFLMIGVFQCLQETFHAGEMKAIYLKGCVGEITELVGGPGAFAININDPFHIPHLLYDKSPCPSPLNLHCPISVSTRKAGDAHRAPDA